MQTLYMYQHSLDFSISQVSFFFGGGGGVLMNSRGWVDIDYAIIILGENSIEV